MIGDCCWSVRRIFPCFVSKYRQKLPARRSTVPSGSGRPSIFASPPRSCGHLQHDMIKTERDAIDPTKARQRARAPRAEAARATTTCWCELNTSTRPLGEVQRRTESSVCLHACNNKFQVRVTATHARAGRPVGDAGGQLAKSAACDTRNTPETRPTPQPIGGCLFP